MDTPSSIGSVRSCPFRVEAGAAPTKRTRPAASPTSQAFTTTGKRRRRGEPGSNLESREMDPRPIGVFDSRMGGPTVLHVCLVTLPHEGFVYLGDGVGRPSRPPA